MVWVESGADKSQIGKGQWTKKKIEKREWKMGRKVAEFK
jgi:hypothetical protein